MARTSDKRERLIDAARNVLYQKGFAGMTIADVAKESGVPIGNVYYYFKTKEALAAAVIDERLEALRERLEAASTPAEPGDRIISFLRDSAGAAEEIARFGCPHGTLVQELEKVGGDLARHARRPLELQLDWLTRQFKEAGLGNLSRAAAEDMFSSIQGITLLTHSFSDPNIMRRAFKRLENWLESRLQAA